MAKALQIIFSFRDDKGKTATTEVKVPTGITLAGAIEYAQQMSILINNVITGQIVSVNIAQPVDISGLGLSVSPGSTSDVEEKGVFQFLTAGNFRTSVSLPTFSDLLVVGGSDAIDQTDGDVIAFRDAMIAGIIPPTYGILVQASDSREDDIVALDYARERFRASGKR